MNLIRQYSKRGFTIVELLIVIVVIALLAAISIVAYNGIQQRSRATSLQSDAHYAATQIEIGRADNNDSYPNSIGGLNLKASDGNSYDYRKINNDYCLTISNQQAGSYFTASNGSKGVGPCPIGYWKLNGDTKDSSIYGGDGINYGATPTADRFGNGSGAMSFDGIASHINTPYNPALNVGQPTMTISAWIKPATLNGTFAVVNRNSPYLFWVDGNQRLYTGLYTNAAGTWKWVGSANGTLSNGAWQQIAMTYDGSIRKLYINGVQSGLDDTQTTGNLTPTLIGVAIGYDACCSRYYFQGAIDDVRIYDKALRDVEIKQLYELANG